MRPIPTSQLRTMDCSGCGKPAWYQWSACALDNNWIPLCPTCDIKINVAVIYGLMGRTDKARLKIAGYKEKVAKETEQYSPTRKQK